MEKTCPICGKPTNVYMGHIRKDGLCREHGMQANKGEILRCPICYKWRKSNEKCPECGMNAFEEVKDKKTRIENIAYLKNDKKESPPIKNEEKNKEIEETPTGNIIIDKMIRCITCGYETDGKLFCKKCYAKYSGKEILIKIKNCREVVPLDDFYEGYYECDDGHVVKSMAERDIDDYLFANNIKHGYEVALPLTDEKGNRVNLHPDFCIFDENGKPLYYIEYWGYDDNNKDYTKTKKFKLPLYEKAKITLININAKTDLRNLKTNLQYKLNNFKKGEINFLNE